MNSTEREALGVGLEPVVGPEDLTCPACGAENGHERGTDNWWLCTACECEWDEDARDDRADRNYRAGFDDGIRAAIACAVQQSKTRYMAPSHYSSRAVLAWLVEKLRDVRPNAN